MTFMKLPYEIEPDTERPLTLEEVQNELLENGGRIKLTDLTRSFGVNHKSCEERKSRFLHVVKKLCMLESRNVLALKPSYRTPDM